MDTMKAILLSLTVLSCTSSTKSLEKILKKGKGNVSRGRAGSMATHSTTRRSGGVARAAQAGSKAISFKKDGISINNRAIIFSRWGIKTPFHPGLASRLRQKSKPFVYRISRYIKHQRESFNFRFNYSSRSVLFMELSRVHGKAPAQLSRSRPAPMGKSRGYRGATGKVRYSVEVKKARGPGNCRGRRCRHRLVDQVAGVAILPLTDRMHMRCKVTVDQVSNPRSKKFLSYFNICRSLDTVKPVPREPAK